MELKTAPSATNSMIHFESSFGDFIEAFKKMWMQKVAFSIAQRLNRIEFFNILYFLFGIAVDEQSEREHSHEVI